MRLDVVVEVKGKGGFRKEPSTGCDGLNVGRKEGRGYSERDTE